MHSDDYKKGWFDGYQAGRNSLSFQPVTPLPVVPGVFNKICGKCGINWERPMGYVCPHSGCPIQPKVRY